MEICGIVKSEAEILMMGSKYYGYKKYNSINSTPL